MPDTAGPIWEKEEFEKGSICASFEGGINFEFDSIVEPESKQELLRKNPLLWPGCL